MSYNPEFSRQVEEALSRQDRSPSWLAQRLGVNRSTVTRWLNDSVRPRDPDTVVRVADVLGMTSQRQRLLAAAGFGYVSESTCSYPSHNLPSPVTALIGRELELDEVAENLKSLEYRLLTIWGSGGIGKTRLAMAVAQAQVDSTHFSDGVYFVSLVPLSHPQQIVPAIAAAMNLPLDTSAGERRRSPIEQLLDFLRNKRLLLLLDNLEHLPEVGELITHILEVTRHVKVLTTSRERLHLPGEQIYPLSGLKCPVDNIISGTDVCDYGALRLFLGRALQCLPDFTLADEELADLVRICRIVDGMPLALELAAAWVDTLTLAEIRQELEANLGFLATDALGVQDRHRSMETAFDASWQLLSAVEQKAFARLSVFRGGFTRDMALRVASASLRVLGNLVGKSFVRFHRSQGRYDIHELLRQYGADRLAESTTEAELAQDRHALFFCTLLQHSYEQLKGSHQIETLGILDTERGNLQVAWERAASQYSLELLEQAMDGLGRFYEWTGNLAIGLNAFAVLAEDNSHRANTEGTRVQAHAMAWYAHFNFLSGYVERAELYLVSGGALLDELTASGEDVRAERALVCLYRGHLGMVRNLAAAIEAYGRSNSQSMEVGNEWEAAVALSWLGRAYRIAERTDAIELLEEARTLLEKWNDRQTLAFVLENIAIEKYLTTSDRQGALEMAQMSLRLRREIGDQIGIANSLMAIAGVHNYCGRPEEADKALAEALPIVQRLGYRIGECRVYHESLMMYEYYGDLEKKRDVAVRGLALARELGHDDYASDFIRGLGALALVRGDFETAYDLFCEIFDYAEKAGITLTRPWLHILRAYSAWKTHKMVEAQYHLTFALKAIVERDDRFACAPALLFLAQVKAVQGDLERAVEIHATGQNVSQWLESLTGRSVLLEPVLEMTKDLSPERKAAARARGKARGVFETAEQLHEEMQEPAWRWA